MSTAARWQAARTTEDIGTPTSTTRYLEVTPRSRMFALLTFIVGFAYCALFAGYGINFEDEGSLLFQVSRFASGDALYEDFHIGYTPGIYYLHGWVMRLFGHGVMAGRWLLTTTIAATMALLYVLCWRVSRREVLSLLAPFLYLASIPIQPGEFAPSNIPYPVWYSVLLWVAGLLVLLEFGGSSRVRSLACAGLLAGVGFAFKPNVGLFQLAASSLFVLAVVRPRPAAAVSRLTRRFECGLWLFWWAAILGGVALVFSGRAGPREAAILLAPVVAVALLVAWQAMVVPQGDRQTPSVLTSALTLGLSFAAVNAPWMLYYHGALGTQRFLTRALFYGADFEKFYFIAHPPVLVAACVGLIAIMALRFAPSLLLRLKLNPGMVMFIVVIAAWPLVIAVAQSRPMPEGFYRAVMSKVELYAFAAVVLAHWAGLWIWARSIGTGEDHRRASIDACVMVIGATFLYLQIYPRTDFMHWVTSAPVSILLGVLLLAKLADNWERPRSRWLPPGAVAGLLLSPLLVIGVMRAGHALGAAFDINGVVPVRTPTVRLDNERAPVWMNIGRAVAYENLADVANFLRENTDADESVFTFPSLDLVSFLAGRSNPTRHGYFFPGWPGHEVEAEVISDLERNPPRFAVVLHWHPMFFWRSAFYYFQLDSFLERHYRPYVRFGPYVVLTHKQLGPDDMGQKSEPVGLSEVLGGDLDRALRQGLRANRPAVRLAALDRIDNLYLRSEYLPLSVALRDPDQRVRDHAARSYRYARDNKVSRLLLEATADELLSPRESRLVMRMVLSAIDLSAVPSLLKLVYSSDATIAATAREALHTIANRELYASFWFGRTDDESDELVELSEADRSRLIWWIGDKRAAYPLRYFAVASHHRLAYGDESCPAAVARVSRDGDAWLRLLALLKMSQQGCGEFEELLKNTTNFLMFEDSFAPRILETLIAGRHDADAIVANILHKGSGPQVLNTIWVAAVYGGPDTAAELIALLEHPEPQFRLAAAWALGNVGDASQAAYLELAQADSDVDVREMAGRALGVMRNKFD